MVDLTKHRLRLGTEITRTDECSKCHRGLVSRELRVSKVNNEPTTVCIVCYGKAGGTLGMVEFGRAAG